LLLRHDDVALRLLCHFLLLDDGLGVAPPLLNRIDALPESIGSFLQDVSGKLLILLPLNRVQAKDLFASDGRSGFCWMAAFFRLGGGIKALR
jgi:hypothetical protein